MTDKVHTSFGRTYRSRETSTAIRYAGTSAGPGWIADTSRRLVEDSEGDLSSGPLGAFSLSTSASSLEVTVASGEAIVDGAYLARDVSTPVSLPANATLTLELGYRDGQPDTVLIGDRGTQAGDGFTASDSSIALADLTTDGSGVTSATDRRTLEEPVKTDANGDVSVTGGQFSLSTASGLRVSSGSTVHLGRDQDRANAGDQSVALGIGARANGDDGAGGIIGSHTAVGYQAAKDNSGGNVTAVGRAAARSNTGDEVTATGLRAAENNTGISLTAAGREAAQTNTGSGVTVTGLRAAQNNTGDDVTASGFRAAQNNSGKNVTASGYQAARGNTGNDVTASGFKAAQSNTGDNVTASGFAAAQQNTGKRVTASGFGAAQFNTGTRVTASGFRAAQNNSGKNVTASGYQAARDNTGNDVTASGYKAARNNSGKNVTASGYKAARNNSGKNVTASGYKAARNNSGDFVTASGVQAAQFNTGDGVIAIGYRAADNNTTNDILVVTDQNGTRRMEMDLTNGDLKIGGSLTQNASL